MRPQQPGRRVRDDGPHAANRPAPIRGAPSRGSVPRRPSAWRALRIIHPFPTALNSAAVVALAMVASHGLPSIGTLLRLASTMFAIQSAIGAVNDLMDRPLDAEAKPWKPIPSGAITPAAARWVAVAAVAVASGLGATFGPAAWALSTAGLAVGLAYDLWLKRSALSGLTYAVALPLVPLWVWTALGRFAPRLLWVAPIGLLLGFALQLVNALPDMEEDAAHGVRGTAQRLGRRGALAAAWGGYLAAVLLALIAGLALGSNPWVLLVGITGALALLAAAVLAHVLRPGSASLQLGWSLLAPGAGLLAVAWLAALP